jgi:DNA-binding NarL/FixJ family response regulator
VHVLHPLPLCDAAVVPRSFELFYTATVTRTLATTLRMTAKREIAHYVIQNAYTVMLIQWGDRQSQPLQENARYLIELATRIAASSCLHHDSSATSFRTVDADPRQQPDDDEFELFWFDIRDRPREPALNVDIPSPRRPEAPFSALVANSDQQLREVIAAWLTQIGAATVHEASTVAEARAHALARGPRDLAILDLEQPDGIELVADLRDRGWRRIVVLTSPDHRCTVPLALQAGAQACLLKPVPLQDDFQGIPGSDSDIKPNDTPKLDFVSSGFGGASSRYDLSTREVKILQLVAEGHSNREIGQTLNRSTATIKSHLLCIGRKLGTGNRARMVVHALRAGIIT